MTRPDDRFATAIAGALLGTRITKAQFLLLMREASCRLDGYPAGWLERAMRLVNELEDER